jgi:hypothetical protein
MFKPSHSFFISAMQPQTRIRLQFEEDRDAAGGCF